MSLLSSSPILPEPAGPLVEAGTEITDSVSPSGSNASRNPKALLKIALWLLASYDKILGDCSTDPVPVIEL